MAGHSKWANIKHKKAAEDRKRAKEFSRLSRLIRAAVREGGSGDPDKNPSLRPILDKARTANMPNKNIQKAVDAGLGKGSNGPVQEVVYEGYGPGGIGLMIVSLTDNKNRTTSEVRYAMSRSGGSLGSPGSVKYMFTRGDEADYVCTMPLEVDDQVKQELESLIDELQDLEDVEEVYTAAKGV